MLEALARANDVPDESLLELYRLAVPEGADPTRVSVGCFIAQQREQVAVLFPDRLSILSREIGKQKNGEKSRSSALRRRSGASSRWMSECSRIRAPRSS